MAKGRLMSKAAQTPARTIDRGYTRSGLRGNPCSKCSKRGDRKKPVGLPKPRRTVHPLESRRMRKDSRSQAGDRVEVRHMRSDSQSGRRTQIRGKNHNTNE